MTDLRTTTGENVRASLLDGLPVTERRLELAEISTPVLDGGTGPDVVLLHDPAEYAAKWLRVIPDLVQSHRVIAPDLPGHGESLVGDGPLDADRVLSWLGELIDRTCSAPPTVVGLILGGGIAARFAVDHGERIRRLVLVDSLGLQPLAPTPEFGQALTGYFAEPSAATHDLLWEQCAVDLNRLRSAMGERWESFAAYNVERMQTPAVQAALQALMHHFGQPAIPAEDLARITVPTTLIWGRHDRATSVDVAREASARYGWPLHVIEDCADDPAMEQPEAFLEALHAALGTGDSAE